MAANGYCLNGTLSSRAGIEDLKNNVIDFLIGPQHFDSRTQGWFLTSGRAALVVCALYLMGVPTLRLVMANRKPLKLQQYMLCHNLCMALLSLWMTLETLRSQYICAGWDKKLVLWGLQTEKGETFSPGCRRLANVLYVHYLSKVLEFADTFIMILRHNHRQVTFLHLYHHATTFLCWWCGINMVPGGDAYFLCVVNSFVHVIMYSYYLVVGATNIRVPLAVKKSITVLQMVQFAMLMGQAVYDSIYEYQPKIAVALMHFQAAVFMILFGNFFRKAYLKKKTAQRGSQERGKTAKIVA